MPTLTVIAGANGSGKSTLTKQLDRPILLIDPDAIARELNPIEPASVAIAAARQALALSQQYIESESSFVVETTLAGNTYIKLMREAKSRGWLIVLMYIGIVDPNINVLRVADRVKLGGHNVPRLDILRRYDRSLANLNKAIKIVDKLILYDNSTDAGHQILAAILFPVGTLREQKSYANESYKTVIYVPELPSWVAKANLNIGI